MTQLSEESIDAYLVRLRGQAQKCNFTSDNMDDNILDQLVKGVAHESVRKKLLDCDQKKLTLDCAMDMARQTYETTQQQLQQLSQADIAVNTVQRRRSQPQQSSTAESQTFYPRCYFCGNEPHPRHECLANKAQCDSRGKMGYWNTSCVS